MIQSVVRYVGLCFLISTMLYAFFGIRLWITVESAGPREILIAVMHMIGILMYFISYDDDVWG